MNASPVLSVSVGPIVPLLFLAAACHAGQGTPLPQEPLSMEHAFPGTHCSAVRPPTEPDLMAWDAGSRAGLAALRTHGVVAVRYRAEGCNVELEVLPHCIGAGAYGYVPYVARDTRILRNNQELFAELPLGAARLGAKLEAGRALRTDYMLVGMATLPPGAAYGADELRGVGCDRATHVVSRIYLGGFAMAAGDAHALEVSARLFGAGAGAGETRASERLAHEGLAGACERAQSDGHENAQCAVPLRLGLLPIAGRPGGCPVGTTLDGRRCIRREVVTQIECPAGTVLEGDTCKAVVIAGCAAGLHFESGRGCVPDAPAPALARGRRPAPRPAKREEPAAPPPAQQKDLIAALAESVGKKDGKNVGASGAAFDRSAAGAALGAITVATCKKADGPTGAGHVVLTFAPDGSVESAALDYGPFAGTAVGGCIASKFREAHVAPFAGAPVRVGKSFTLL